MFQPLKVSAETDRCNPSSTPRLNRITCSFFFTLWIISKVQVQPERQADGQIVYSASNPDEGAFIYAAAHFGHRFLRREGKDVVLSIPKPSTTGTGASTEGDKASSSARTSSQSTLGKTSIGQGGGFGGGGIGSGGKKIPTAGIPEEGTEDAEEVTFQILHSFAFTSDRKRSSVIVRRRRTRSEGSAEGGGSAERSGGGGGGEGVVLYCKGADNVILERLDKEKNSRELVDKIKANIAEFTQDGEYNNVLSGSGHWCSSSPHFLTLSSLLPDELVVSRDQPVPLR